LPSESVSWIEPSTSNGPFGSMRIATSDMERPHVVGPGGDKVPRAIEKFGNSVRVFRVRQLYACGHALQLPA
jgi:hypothetical protein